MNELFRPESTQRRPEPLRIFSGARLRPDGSFVSPAHQKIDELWRHEVSQRTVPGILRRIPTTEESETRIALRITPKNKAAGTLLENLRNRFETGVMNWVKDGSPFYSDIGAFRNDYIGPLEQDK